jgi:D-amino-acid dehydrogenase
MKLPIYPVKGCSATYQVREPDKAAHRGLIDEHHLVGIARLGNRMRFAGRAIFDYPNTEVDLRDFSGIEAVATELYGDALDIEAKSLWACLRPMTPDGPPILGTTPYSNLYLNTGHGHIGWTMACGSAALLTQLIGKREPDIDLAKYNASRYWN